MKNLFFFGENKCLDLRKLSQKELSYLLQAVTNEVVDSLNYDSFCSYLQITEVGNRLLSCIIQLENANVQALDRICGDESILMEDVTIEETKIEVVDEKVKTKK